MLKEESSERQGPDYMICLGFKQFTIWPQLNKRAFCPTLNERASLTPRTKQTLVNDGHGSGPMRYVLCFKALTDKLSDCIRQWIETNQVVIRSYIGYCVNASLVLFRITIRRTFGLCAIWLVLCKILKGRFIDLWHGFAGLNLS